MTLFCKNGRSDSLTLEGRLAGGECVAVTVVDGVIARIEPAAGTRRVLAPAFVDPHVHLRSPGREDEETIASGTAAAAAGGYCAILAMPNTDPVVDSAAVLGSLVEAARREALVPTGFMAAISKKLGGEELTEMAELADAGAAAFTDDGRPVISAGLMRRALQYGAVTGRKLALHCEEPTLSRDGQVHEGPVSAELGFAPYPSVAESAMVERDLSLAGYEHRPLHLMHLSAKESVDALRAAHARGVEASAEVTPHHLVLTDEAVRSLDPNVKMNPPLQGRRGPQGADRGASRRHDRVRRDRPRSALPRGEGGAVRGGAVRRHRARDRVRGALHPSGRAGAHPARDAARADVRRAGSFARLARAADRGRRARQSRPARPRDGVDGRGAGLPLPLGELLAPRRTPARRGREDGRRRTAWCTDERLPRSRGRHDLSRPVGRRAGRRLRRGRVHDRDDRLPGDRHRPQLRRAARLLHRADGRQLRRRGRAGPSRPARTRTQC